MARYKSSVVYSAFFANYFACFASILPVSRFILPVLRKVCRKFAESVRASGDCENLKKKQNWQKTSKTGEIIRKKGRINRGTFVSSHLTVTDEVNIAVYSLYGILLRYTLFVRYTEICWRPPIYIMHICYI